MFNHKHIPLDIGDEQPVGTGGVQWYKDLLLIIFVGTDTDCSPTAYLGSRRGPEDNGSEGWEATARVEIQVKQPMREYFTEEERQRDTHRTTIKC